MVLCMAPVAEAVRVGCSCCTDASSFFGSNCQNDQFIYAQATGPFGFTDASLKAGENVYTSV